MTGTYYEILEELWARRRLTRNEIINTWNLTEEQYSCILSDIEWDFILGITELSEADTDFRRRLDESKCVIRKGGRGTGGLFIARKGGPQIIEEPSGEKLLLMTEWETRSADRLSELLTGSELSRLAGRDLRSAVRHLRWCETRVDGNTKMGLATALVLRHGIDLFCDADIRKHVSDACKVPYPQRWRPGKGASVEFVAQVGFPHQLAGIPSPESLLDYERLEGRFDLPLLKDFQKEVKKKLDRVLANRGRRAIVTLPTGAGKTRIAVESIRDFLTRCYKGDEKIANGVAVLWLAHTQELCEQAYICFRQVWTNSVNVCPLLLMRFWGHYTHDLTRHGLVLQQILCQPSVLISTPHRVINLLDNRVESGATVAEGLKQCLGVLLIDEAHRAAAPSYRRILKDLVECGRPTSVVGLTATPFRMEYAQDDRERGTRDLKDIFRSLIEPVQTLGEDPDVRLKTLQERRILAKPEFSTIDTGTVIRIGEIKESGSLSDEEIESIDWRMAFQADKTDRRLAILKQILPLAKEQGNSILYFGPSVRDAEVMTFLLRRERIPAEVVSGKTRDATRRQVVNRFKQGEIRVLCNCDVLTTGFDAPRVTHIVVARPTASEVLYEQMVGRGLRGPEFGGTETCVIIDCQDDFRGTPPPLGYKSLRKVWKQEAEFSRRLGRTSRV